MPAQSVTLIGAAELGRKLRELEPKIAKKAMRKALRAGGKIILLETKRLAPRDTGKFAKSLKLRGQKRTRKNRLGVNIQTREGDYGGETFYGAFVTHGHAIGKRTGGHRKKTVATSAANTRKRTPPNPFMAAAAAAKKNEAAAAIRAVLLTELAAIR